ncbi:MAG: competence/damage-inducible protein A, partial [Actinomycetota bacterium]|nr:competence/damage-inducible protein A [Actinomycetota bacterium]
MNVEIVAVGTELLLGQIADTNGRWLGEQLAAAGVDSYFHQAVGDNQRRIVTALSTALARSDAAITCGGLGPTQDDITREAIAEVMNVPLVRHSELAHRIEQFFSARGRTMPENNLRQADVPEGAAVIDQRRGTAPGLICPIGRKVVYALPGVPHEMAEMFERAVLPDLERRMAEAGERGVIQSRVLRTWGVSESALAEALQGRIDALDARSGTGGRAGTVTIAFLASGIEGLKVRLTARADDSAAARSLLDAEEREVRGVLDAAFGDIVFGVDEVSMEQAVATLLVERGMTLGVAESLTGGLVASRLVDVPGASTWLRGGVVAYDSKVKFSVLGLREGPVVTDEAAVAMAQGACRVLGAAVGLGITGVAGPDPQEGLAPGTVFVGLALAEGASAARR